MKALVEKIKELNKKGQPVLIGTASIDRNEEIHELLKKEGVVHEVLNAKNHEKEGEIIAKAGGKGKVTIATNLAGRGVDIKLGGIDCSKEEYEEVKRLGGLFVLGTERHEARRIDDQLRGRSGRQGDEGETQFYVSMDDSLLKAFGSDKMKLLMDKLGVDEDQNVENRFISKSIESAQKRIEGYYFDARKLNLEYDNILNNQREEFYKKRKDILLKEELKENILDLTSANFSEYEKKMGSEDFSKTLRSFLLQILDTVWVEHLELMDYARTSVSLRSYGQNNPLVEYKKEAKRLFSLFFGRVSEIIEKNLSNFANFLPKDN